MRFRFATILAAATLIGSAALAAPTPTEQDLVNQFLRKAEKKHGLKRLGWASFTFTTNRINRNNDYNSFANHVNQSLSGGRLSWLGQAYAFGADFGVGINRSMAWLVGGEYWLKTGEKLSGTVSYTPPSGGGAIQLVDPQSQISVYGVYTGAMYSLYNPRGAGEDVLGTSAWISGTIGYYNVSWDVFSQYQNLNLSTSTPDGSNAAFKGSAPGFSIGAGLDYPLGMAGMALGLEASYLHLNFANVAWYNEANQEVVATYADTPDSRVDLNLSGIRARLALKKYFSW